MSRTQSKVILVVGAVLFLAFIALVYWPPAKPDPPGPKGGTTDPAGGGEKPPVERPHPPVPSPIVAIGTKLPIKQPESPPAKLTEEDLLAWYPAGKKVRNVALFVMTGKGHNQQWFIKGESNFAYTYQVASETAVISNEPKLGRLIFRQSFGDVVQQRAVSRKSLELALPDSLLFRAVWGHAERELISRIPGYRDVRRLAAIAQLIDPRLKRTLTQFASWLEAGGVALSKNDDVEFAARFDKLSGVVLDFEYVTGLGVVSVTLKRGTGFTAEDLEQLAQSSTLLMDYFIFPAASKRVGERWTVRAQDLSGWAMPWAARAQTAGELTFQRAADQAGVVMMTATAGSLTATQQESGRSQRVTISVDHGQLRFSPTEKIIRDARLSWSFTGKFESTDFLLFGTERFRDLHVHTRYEAQAVK